MIAAAKGREQLAIGLLFGLGLLLGLAVAPVIADYAEADPSAVWQAARQRRLRRGLSGTVSIPVMIIAGSELR